MKTPFAEPASFVLLVLLCSTLGSYSSAAPVQEETENQESLDYLNDEAGCYYNFQHYTEGDRIVTNEPCLNCTCHNRMLMCYLRVCPFTKAIGQDCTVEKHPDQCCPVITCPEVPVKLLTSTTEQPSTTTAVGAHDNYGCTIRNAFFADGVQVPSDPRKPCELCYCIRNRTACVMQECTLHVEGCTPVYQPGVCCPVRYECDYEDVDTSSTSHTSNGTLVLSTTAPSLDCRYEEEVFADGESIATDKPCEHCYCMRGDIVCAVQDCGEPLRGKDCTPHPIPPGQCCPASYTCANETVSYADPDQSNDIITQVQGIINSIQNETQPDIMVNTAEIIIPENILSPENIHDTTGGENLESNYVLPSNSNNMEIDSGVLHDNHPETEGELPINKEPSNSQNEQDSRPNTAPETSDGVEVVTNEPVESPTEKPSYESELPVHGDGNNIEPIVSNSETSSAPESYETQAPTENVQDPTHNHEQESDSVSPNSEVVGESSVAPELQSPESATITEQEPSLAGAAIPASSDGTFETVTEDNVEETPSPVLAVSENIETSNTEVPEKDSNQPSQFEGETVTANTPEVSSSNSDSPVPEVVSIIQDNVEKEVKSTPSADSITESSGVKESSSTSPIPLDKVDQISSDKIDNPVDSVNAGEIHHDQSHHDFPTHDDEEIPFRPSDMVDVEEASGNTADSELHRIPGEGNCLIDGKTYLNTSTIPTSNPCHIKCECISSIPSCILVNCAPPPPQHKECTPVQPGPDTCCPTYTCEEDNKFSFETHNQVSEKPQTAATTSDQEKPGQADLPEAIKEPNEQKEQGTTKFPLVESTSFPIHKDGESFTNIPKEDENHVETATPESDAGQPVNVPLSSDQTVELNPTKVPEQGSNLLVEAVTTSQPVQDENLSISSSTSPQTDGEAASVIRDGEITHVSSESGHKNDQESNVHSSSNSEVQDKITPTTFDIEDHTTESSEVLNEGAITSSGTIAEENNLESTHSPEVQNLPIKEKDPSLHVTENFPIIQDNANHPTEVLEVVTTSPETHHDESKPFDTEVESTSADVATNVPIYNADTKAPEDSKIPTVETSAPVKDQPEYEEGTPTSLIVEDVEPTDGAVTGVDLELHHDKDHDDSEKPDDDSEKNSDKPSQQPGSDEPSENSAASVGYVQTELPTVVPEVPIQNNEEINPQQDTGSPALIPVTSLDTKITAQSSTEKLLDAHPDEVSDFSTKIPANSVDSSSSGAIESDLVSSPPLKEQDVSENTGSESAEKPNETSPINAIIFHGNEHFTKTPESDSSIVLSTERPVQSNIIDSNTESEKETSTSVEFEPVDEVVVHDNIHEEPVPQNTHLPNAPSEEHVEEVVTSLAPESVSVSDNPLIIEDNESKVPEIVTLQPEEVNQESNFSSSNELPSTTSNDQSINENPSKEPTAVNELPVNTESSIFENEETLQIVGTTEGDVVSDSENLSSLPISSPNENKPAEATNTAENDNLTNGQESFTKEPFKTPPEINELDSNSETEATVAPQGVPGETLNWQTVAPVLTDNTGTSNLNIVEYVDSVTELLHPIESETILPIEPLVSQQDSDKEENSANEETIKPTGEPVLIVDPTEISAVNEKPGDLVPEDLESGSKQPLQTESSSSSDQLENVEPTTIEIEKLDEQQTAKVPLDHQTSGENNILSSPEENTIQIVPAISPSSEIQTDDSNVPVDSEKEGIQGTESEISATESVIISHSDEQNVRPDSDSLVLVSAQTLAPEEANTAQPEVNANNQKTTASPAEQPSKEPNTEISPEQPNVNSDSIVSSQAPEVVHASVEEQPITADLEESLTAKVPILEVVTETEHLQVTDKQPPSISFSESGNTDLSDAMPTVIYGSGLATGTEYSTVSHIEATVSTKPQETPVSSTESGSYVEETTVSQNYVISSSEATNTSPSNPVVDELLNTVPADSSNEAEVQTHSQSPNVQESGTVAEAKPEPFKPSDNVTPEQSIFDKPTEKPIHQNLGTDALSSFIHEHLNEPNKTYIGLGTDINSQLSELLNRVPTSTLAPFVPSGVTHYNPIQQSSWTPKPIHQTSKPEDVSHRPGEEASFPDVEYEEDDEDVFGPGTCKYGGKLFVSAQQIPRDDPCDFCFCFRSDIICLQQSCPPPIFGCRQESISGFCCPRYGCPVSKALVLNVTSSSSTTSTTTTLPPHFNLSAYKGNAVRRGCALQNHAYEVNEVMREASGPCRHCICGADGHMQCEPKSCSPEPMVRKLIEEVISRRRR